MFPISKVYHIDTLINIIRQNGGKFNYISEPERYSPDYHHPESRLIYLTSDLSFLHKMECYRKPISSVRWFQNPLIFLWTLFPKNHIQEILSAGFIEDNSLDLFIVWTYPWIMHGIFLAAIPSPFRITRYQETIIVLQQSLWSIPRGIRTCHRA